MDIDFETNPITEEEVIAILGNNYKTQGSELVWKCPACPNGDKSGDNLKFNRDKHILKCFACDYGTEITGIIARRRYEVERGDGEVTPPPPPPVYNSAPRVEETVEKEKEIPQDKLDTYYWNCLVNLMQNKDVMRKMYEKHTILPKTAMECFIGYDHIKDMLVFPSRAVGKDPTQSMPPDLTANGAEYREYTGDKKIRRISGYEAKICCVHGTPFCMRGILCEGYKDAYNLYQILQLTDPERLSYTAIFTVQNGTNSINYNGCLQKVNWKRYDEMLLLMDNDAAGDKATEIALGHFNNMRDYRQEFLGEYNDIQQKFKAEFGDKVDIEKALSAPWIDEWKNETLI